MKKYFFAFAAIAAILAGCAKDIDNQNTIPDETLVVLRASVPEDGTRVSTDNAGAYSWQTGDKITVLNTSGSTFEFTTTAGGTSVDFSSASFTGTLSTEAMYPASANHATGKFYLEPTIAWNANASMMPMLGTVNTSELTASFKPVGSVLKLVCFNVDAAARKLVVSSDTKKLNGEFTPSGDPKVITAAAKGGSDNTVTITFDDGHPGNMVFYIPLPTGDLGKLTFVMKNSSDANVSDPKVTKGNVEISRNQIVVAPALNCAPATVLVSEDFSSYSADDVPSGVVNGVTYACTDGGGTTKIYDAVLAGGESPELLIGKSSGTFKISGIDCDGITSMILTFKKNNQALTVTATDGITVSGATSGTGTKTITLTNVGTGDPKTPLTSFDLTFTAGASNVRFDDVLLTVAPAAYTAPALTPDEDALEIAVGSTTATTDFTYANKVDEMPVVAVVSDDAEEWLSAAITGAYPDYTLTVTASGAYNGAADRTGTVTLRASGVKKAIAVTQKTKLVPNPTVAVTPGDSQFSASWTADANASSYVAYLHTAATATPATGGTDITSSISNSGSAYSITDYAVANGDYYLYIKVNGVSSGYEAPTSYVEKSFTCEGTPKGSAEDNPYNVAEAIDKYDETGANVSNVYVMGIVSTAGFLSSSKVCCYISVDGTTATEFELYNITSGEGTAEFAVGDAVIAHGTLTKYNSTYELSGTTIDALIKKPVFTPNGANFVTSQSVSIASTGSSSIRYTTDGSAPTVSTGSVYSSALDFSATTTVKAVGIDANDVVCTAVASATFAKVSAYAVTWSAPSNGSITVKHGETTLTSGNTVPEGETVTITVTPDDGYSLSTLVYNDGSDHDIKAAKSFTMPGSAVSITATFETASEKEVTLSIADYATSNSWSNGTAYTSVTIDSNISATGATGGNNSKYYSSNNSWRFYEGDSGTITITASSGTIKTITFNYASGNNGVLTYGGENKTSGTSVTINSSSAVFGVTHSSGTKNGNVQVTSITVVYQ